MCWKDMGKGNWYWKEWGPKMKKSEGKAGRRAEKELGLGRE